MANTKPTGDSAATGDTPATQAANPNVTLDPAHVPARLRKRLQWVCWKYITRDGKQTKCPMSPTKRGPASSTDPATWGTFEQAIAAYKRRSDLAGIGFVFTETDPYVGIDVDGCCASEGIIDADTYELIKPLQTYCEWSPSGRGIHLIVEGEKPGPLCRNGNVEIYDRGRFFCMTGNRLPFSPAEVSDCGNALVEFYTTVFGPLGETPRENTTAVDVTPDPSAEVPADKLQVLIDNDPKFKATWERQRPDLNDQSASSYDLSLASHATSAGWDDDEVAALIREWRVEHCENPNKALRPDYINRTIAKARAGRSYTFGLTDLGNAERFVRDHGEDIRYCAPFGRWYLWDGQRWCEDTTLAIYQKTRITVRNIYREAAACNDASRRKLIAQHAKASESEHRIKAMVSLARSDPTVAVTPDAFDRDPFLLNCENGTIDLRTGELLGHRRDDLLSKMAPVRYDPAARAPLWDRFLHRILDGNTTLIQYMQRLCGVALTADIREQILPVLWGSGANGKSTLVDTLCDLMGDYATIAAAELLTIRRNEEHPTEIADLFGRRLVVACESEEGKRLRCEFIKRCTGDAKLKARRMRQDYFSFNRTNKTWLVTNNLPRVPDDDIATWRRIKLVPFVVTIPEAEQDKSLLTRMRGEWPGILGWAVRGCLRWLKYGLGEPDEVATATAEYRQQEDRLAEFIAEWCIVAPGLQVSRAALRKAYREWCDGAGDKWPVSSKKLYEGIRQRGARDTEFTEHGRTVRGFTGIGLRE